MKNNSPSPEQIKLDNLKFVLSMKLQSIMKLRNTLPEASEARQCTINAAIDSIKKEYDIIYEQIQELTAKLTQPKETKTSTTSFPPLSFEDLLNLPPKQWLIDQVFGSGDIGVIYGPPGCGKTFVVIDLIMSACTGRSWAMRFNASRPLNVAYCAGEGIGGLPSRFQAAAAHYNIASLPNFTFFKSTPQLYNDTEDHSKDILQFATEWNVRQLAGEADQLDVLVIDTLHTASEGADENSSKEMGLILKACRQTMEMLGCTILLVHHTNKSGDEERGSSSLRGAMDFMFRITKAKDDETSNASLICSKLKDGEQWRSQGFHLEKAEDSENVHIAWNDPHSFEDPGKKSKSNDKAKILSTMRTSPDVGFTSKSLSEVIGQSSTYTNRLLKELIEGATCYQKLSDPDKSSSNRNPWLFYAKY